jgi:3'5'-cyclic nucleotide phosphodiesterase
MSSYPKRKSNTLYYAHHDSNHEASYICMMDFTEQAQYQAKISMGISTVVVLVMIMSTLFVSNLVAIQVFLPLDRLLMKLKQMTEVLFGKNVKSKMEDDEYVIDNTLKQISEFIKLSNSKKIVADTRGMAKEDLGILHMVQNHMDDLSGGASGDDLTKFLPDQNSNVAEMNVVSREIIDSWNFCILEYPEISDQYDVLSYIFFESKQSINGFVKRDKFMNLMSVVQSKYYKINPYHSWEHAIDVTHCLYRYLETLTNLTFLKQIDRFGLLLAAISHDIGHIGVNNSFLVETRDELAMRFNDISPLENMHCSLLFGLLASDTTNVLASLSKDEYREI